MTGDNTVVLHTRPQRLKMLTHLLNMNSIAVVDVFNNLKSITSSPKIILCCSFLKN